MSTIFTMIRDALAPYVGGSDAAGALLGLGLVTAFFFAFLLAFGRDFFNKQTGFILMLVVISFASAPGVDWLPLWTPFLIVISLAFMYWQKYL